VVEEPWARIETLIDGVWAVISTPREDRTTLCNGAIVAGRDGVLVLEAFGSVVGARWVADWARKLARRAPDEVVLSHFHYDHTTGVAGYAGDGEAPCRVHATDATVRLVGESDVARKVQPDPVKARMLAERRPIDPAAFSRIDLGGRVVRVTPLAGHTPSDVLLEVEDANVVLGGDLLWNRYFPNYMSAIPSTLSSSVRGLLRDCETRYIPGHGPVADRQEVERYIELIELVDDAAREAFRQGTPAAEAARRFVIPSTLGEWAASPRSLEVAFTAWEKELRGPAAS
jgi:glyoxylase-like metal-dependent hydrolase (beta-lactamase superfamily II)